jgi:hypothetical protein
MEEVEEEEEEEEVVEVRAEVVVVLSGTLLLWHPALQCAPETYTSSPSTCPIVHLYAKVWHPGTAVYPAHEPIREARQKSLGTKRLWMVPYCRQLHILPRRHTSHKHGPQGNHCKCFWPHRGYLSTA